MFGKSVTENKLRKALSIMLSLWTGVLLIYTFSMNPLIGFFVSAVLWRLTKFDGKRNELNKKKLLLIGLLIFFGENCKADEFIFNAVVGLTAFQFVSLLTKSEKKSQQNWLPIVYVTMAIYYTLRMTLVFDVPDALIPAHNFFTATTEYLRANKTIEWTISISLVVLNTLIFLKTRSQNHLPLIMSLFFGMCGMEDMSAVIGISVLGKLILKIKMGDEAESEHKKSVQQTGKIYKL